MIKPSHTKSEGGYHPLTEWFPVDLKKKKKEKKKEKEKKLISHLGSLSSIILVTWWKQIKTTQLHKSRVTGRRAVGKGAVVAIWRN